MDAFVLSGGANLAAVQVGMLRALYERGIAPEMLIGTSAGALNAAFVAERPATVATTDELAEIWLGLRRGDVFPLSPISAILGVAGTRDHLVSGHALRELVRRHVLTEHVEDTPIPLHIIAADALGGQEVCLSEGPLVEAVLASTAIPGILPPVDWAGQPLFDGGVVNNAPISSAIAHGATRIYVLPAGHSCALQETPRSALNMALHALTLLVQRQLIADIETYRDTVDLVAMPPPCPLAVTPGDFSRAEELIDGAYAGAVEFLDTGGAERPPLRMTMHHHGRAA